MNQKKHEDEFASEGFQVVETDATWAELIREEVQTTLPVQPPLPPQYQQWINAKLSTPGPDCDPFTKCAEWTLEMQAAFPELIRVRGQVFLSNLWERDHWWLKKREGEIVDPTKAQFAQEYYSGGVTVLWYQERDESEPEPTGMCPNCGGYIYGGGDMCSDSCARAYCAYLGVGWGGEGRGGDR